MKKFLIIENSPVLRESLAIILRNEGEVITSSSLIDGISLLRKDAIDLILLGTDDLLWNIKDLVEELVEIKKQVPLMLIGEQRFLTTYQTFLEGYVVESIVLPFKVYELRKKVRETLSGFVPPLKARSHENRLIEEYQRFYESSFLDSRVKRSIPKILRGKSPILLWGEKGSGKETVAKIIHYLGSKNAGAFIKFDCATLTEDALASQLQAMPSPAVSEHAEVSWYWDEIGRLSLEIQMRVEEILEEGLREFSLQGLPASPRIIASSSEDLNEAVARGVFRESLLYRLNHFPLRIKPLRERIDDLPHIAGEIINRFVGKDFTKKKQISPEAMEILKNYYWPGNLRELESVLLRSCLIAEEEMITRHDIFFTGEEVPAQGIKRTLFVSPVVSEEPETTFEQLLTGLAHEIKNPLVAIKTFTQLLSERFDDAEFRKQFYQIVGKSIDRIEWLTKRVVDYANFLETRLIPVNFPALLDHIITQHQTALRTKKITVQREGLESLSSSTVLSDPRQLSYILENIIVYCVSDLPEGSHVVFSARISHLEAKERERFPFKDLLTDRMVELNITCPSLTHVSPTGVPVSLPSTRFYSLELFLSQAIVNRNLGIMERTVDQVGTVITIKMPVDECLRKEMHHEENSDCG